MKKLASVITRAVPASLALLLAASTAKAQPSAAPGWTLYGQPAEYDAKIDSNVFHGGHASALLRSRMKDVYGRVALGQTFSAAPFRNQRIRFSTWIRTRGVRGAGAYTSVTFLGRNGTSVGFTELSTEPQNGTSKYWLLDTLTVSVPHAAVSIQYAVTVEGLGEVWVDDVSIEQVGGANATTASAATTEMVDGGFERTKLFKGDVVAKYDPPRAVTAKGLDAMIAFARLTGYVRFFHPSDSVVTTNWSQFLVDGLRAAEKSTTTDALQRTMQKQFASVAPTVRIFRSSGPVPAFVASRPAKRDSVGIAWWFHNGVDVATAQGQHYSYFSNRELQPMQSVLSLPPGISSPETPLRVELGAGLSALVPTSLWMTVPTKTEDRRKRPSRVYVQGMSANDRGTRLAAIAELWMIMQHFYPYFDVAKTDWARELRAALTAAATDPTATEFEITLERMVAALHDGNGSVYRSKAIGGVTKRSGYGIGYAVIDGKLLVTRVTDSSRTDIKRGDIIVGINGKPVREAITERLARISSATPQFSDLRLTIELMSASNGDSLQLQLQSARAVNAPVRNVTLWPKTVFSRADVPLDIRPANFSELKRGVLYIAVNELTDSTLTIALPKLRAATDIIIDMRYPSGYSGQRLLSMLTDSVLRSPHFEIPVVTRPDGKGVTYRDISSTIAPTKPRLQARAYFLADASDTRSAEAILGTVENYKLGEIVGEPTAGVGNGDVSTFALPGGFNVTWSAMRVRKQDGTQLHGAGIQPTVPVRRTVQGVLDGRDEQLERALAMIAARHKGK